MVAHADGGCSRQPSATSQPATDARHGARKAIGTNAVKGSPPPATPASGTQEDLHPSIELPPTRIVLAVDGIGRHRLRFAMAFCVGRLRGTTGAQRRQHGIGAAPGQRPVVIIAALGIGARGIGTA